MYTASCRSLCDGPSLIGGNGLDKKPSNLRELFFLLVRCLTWREGKRERKKETFTVQLLLIRRRILTLSVSFCFSLVRFITILEVGLGLVRDG